MPPSSNIRRPERGVVEHRDAGLAVVRAEGDTAPRRFKLSDSTVDRYNSTLAVEGWQLDAFNRNPIMLYGHWSWDLPIGRWSPVEVTDGALFATPAVWAETNQAREVKALVEADILRACSVGFDPIKWTVNEARGGVDYLEQELLEVSIVSIPGNSNALAEGRARGLSVDAIAHHLERALKSIRSNAPAQTADVEALLRMGSAPKVYSYTRTDGAKSVKVESPDLEGLRTLRREIEEDEREEGEENDDASDEPKDEPKDDEATDEERNDKTCPACSETVEGEWKFCAACGRELTPDETETKSEMTDEEAERAIRAAIAG